MTFWRWVRDIGYAGFYAFGVLIGFKSTLGPFQITWAALVVYLTCCLAAIVGEVVMRVCEELEES